jgi:hypothetical protein
MYNEIWFFHGSPLPHFVPLIETKITFGILSGWSIGPVAGAALGFAFAALMRLW